MLTLRNRLRRLPAGGSLWLPGFLALAACLGYGQTTNSCLDCHSALPAPYTVTQEQFSQDIHAQKGLTCTSCHGGDASASDPDQSMSRKAGWKGKIDRKQVPQLCGSCHSDPAYMRQYDPSLRTDQLAQYHTSMHGKLLASGDTKVAVCTDCHSVHNIRPPGDPRSTVYPINIAKTCSRCHSDAATMKPYGIPTNQYAQYLTSVHYKDLVVGGDLSAPTCTTCHGDHGAVPPGVDKVQNVCATCHVFQARMYEKSLHFQAFQAASLPGCVVCHSNHAIHQPSDAMLGTGPSGVCMSCHARGDQCDQARAAILTDLTQLDRDITNADQALHLAESSGMEVSAALLNQDQARDALIKARVTIHTFQPVLVDADVQTGMKIADADLKVGQDAMVERDHRRIGLGISLIAIAMVLAGLWLNIKRIES
ncbi:MAG: cytochrome c3 family protein [Terracidiphilus sp.]